ncbi:hypothetical protein J1N35_043575 [Gossypium stocksii]|uniref:RNase H type-1 domain-containing protein n=1 Tax=Gossypium stocksii TaxID=47602 RepID=A0A9D3ZF76_9ROSI|nr:hypothetical protein J1N35_043575 [Gossypium stocksii]
MFVPNGSKLSSTVFAPGYLDGCVYLSTDGSVQYKDMFAVAGGLLRDQKSAWIVGFTRYLRNCEVIDSKLWGILDGLQIALDCGFRNVIIRTDSLEATNLIHEGVHEGVHEGSNFALLMRIQLILKQLRY